MSGVVPEESSSKQIKNLHMESVSTRDCTTSLPTNDEASARQRRQVNRAIFLQMLSLLLLSYYLGSWSLWVCFPTASKGIIE